MHADSGLNLVGEETTSAAFDISATTTANLVRVENGIGWDVMA